MGWWVDLASSGFMGLVVALVLAGLALVLVCLLVIGLVQFVRFLGRSFKEGWDRVPDKRGGYRGGEIENETTQQ